MKMQTKLVAKETQNIKVTVPEIRWKNKIFLLFVVVNTNYGIATITRHMSTMDFWVIAQGFYKFIRGF